MGKQTLMDRIKSLCSSMGWKMFIWGLGISQEEYWDRIYLQEARLIMVTDGRRVGNSTRLIDFYIQRLFDVGSVTVSDHYHTRQATIRIYSTMLNRLKHEHGMGTADLVLDNSTYTMELSNDYKQRTCQTT